MKALSPHPESEGDSSRSMVYYLHLHLKELPMFEFTNSFPILIHQGSDPGHDKNRQAVPCIVLVN